jgi:hypothetical protein
MIRTSRLVLVIAIVTVIAGCSSAGGGAAPTGGGAAGPNGLPGSACSLLSTAEIQSAIGAAVKAGVETDTDTQVGCDWASATDTGPAAGIVVAKYNDSLWQAGAGAGISKAVSGIGDAAFENWPTAGTLNVKAQGYAVTVGVADFNKTSDQADAEATTLAQLVLSRI